MPVYMLFIRENAVRDQSALDIYSRMNRAAPRDPNLKPLVMYGATEAVEGTAPDGMVMLEFPTPEAAKAWYDSPVTPVTGSRFCSIRSDYALTASPPST